MQRLTAEPQVRRWGRSVTWPTATAQGKYRACPKSRLRAVVATFVPLAIEGVGLPSQILCRLIPILRWRKFDGLAESGRGGRSEGQASRYSATAVSSVRRRVRQTLPCSWLSVAVRRIRRRPSSRLRPRPSLFGIARPPPCRHSDRLRRARRPLR